jgi:phosphomannomutase
MMTVSGIRGVVGDTFTAALCAQIAYHQTKRDGCGVMVIARDTRPSGAALAEAAAGGIVAAGGTPVDIGIAPTPTACVAVAHLGAAGGIILTASHNPSPYNGYKMINRAGRLCNGAECEEVYRLFRAATPADYPRMDPTSKVRQLDASPVHIDRIIAAVDVDAIRAARLKIALDSTNGAGGRVFPALLDKLGVEWVGVHTGLDGNFVHNPEPRPEHLTDLAALLRDTPGMWGGFAFDPDADRLATMGEHGEPVSEELTLAFALANILAREKTCVATNLSTSMVIDEVARSFGVDVVRTKIGEANVVEGMLRDGCKAGGEGNGGVIYPRISTVRDGPGALALILELMAMRRQPITGLQRMWPAFHMVKDKIPAPAGDPAAQLDALARRFSSDTVDTQDGLKIIRPNGWVHIRASNTEPILRCIAEARSWQEARELVDAVVRELAAP